jgi:hypothetical protein
VDIVILNGLLAILYASGLKKPASIYAKHHNITVNFYVPNFKEKKLVPLERLLGLLRDLSLAR